MKVEDLDGLGRFMYNWFRQQPELPGYPMSKTMGDMGAVGLGNNGVFIDGVFDLNKLGQAVREYLSGQSPATNPALILADIAHRSGYEIENPEEFKRMIEICDEHVTLPQNTAPTDQREPDSSSKGQCRIDP